MKIKKQVIDRLRALLADDESVEATISFGKFQFRPGAVERPEDRDYLLVTDKRILVVKGEWFKKGEGVSEYQRQSVRGASSKNFLLGCTVTLRVAAGDGEEKELVFENCGKPEGEAAVKILTVEAGINRCPMCDRELTGDFTFCPYCNAGLKLLCSNCGKPLQMEWKNCPFCGKA
ncbi:MAG: zinc ribbon domain-containing protein [bacterium]